MEDRTDIEDRIIQLINQKLIEFFETTWFSDVAALNFTLSYVCALMKALNLSEETTDQIFESAKRRVKQRRKQEIQELDEN